VNELFSELKRLIELDHLIATPYSKEENGIVENASKQVSDTSEHLSSIKT
jgi:hypothetical protein